MHAPYPIIRNLLCIAPTVGMLLFLYLFIGPEDAVYAYFTEARAAHPSWTIPMEMFTHGALFAFYPVYFFILLHGVRRKNAADVVFTLSYLFAQFLVAALLCRVLKIAVGRPRPMTGGGFAPFSLGWGYQSFPSGHTGEIIGSCMPFIWRYGRYAPLCMPLVFGTLVAAVAFSRLYLGMHHPTDLLGGLVIGSVSGYLSWKFFGALMERWRDILPCKVKAWLKIS